MSGSSQPSLVPKTDHRLAVDLFIPVLPSLQIQIRNKNAIPRNVLLVRPKNFISYRMVHSGFSRVHHRNQGNHIVHRRNASKLADRDLLFFTDATDHNAPSNVEKLPQRRTQHKVQVSCRYAMDRLVMPRYTVSCFT